MFNAPPFVRIVCGGLCCALAALLVPAAMGQTIDLSLNIHYIDPMDVNSGGTWEVVGKSSHSGIASLSLRLANIDAAVQFTAPRGVVNGSDGAGFSLRSNLPQDDHRNVILHQTPIPPNMFEAGDEQTIFYGVGTLMNGAPNWPGKPPGTVSIGPTFTSLSGVQGVPWATGDVLGNPLWDTAAVFASGTFEEGVTPEWFSGTTGQVFTSVGTSTMFGSIQPATITTIVRVDPNAADILPDYNLNGVVDAADYVLWRSGAFPAADGNNNGTIDSGDYDLWVEHFGEVFPGAGAGANHSATGFAVPEPTTGLLATLGIGLFASRRGRRSVRALRLAASIKDPATGR